LLELNGKDRRPRPLSDLEVRGVDDPFRSANRGTRESTPSTSPIGRGDDL
jgi:hypothetical protein